MSNKKLLLLEQLDEKLAYFKGVEKVLIPKNGWVNTIRTTLNMTMNQLATRLKLTSGAIQKIEEREATGKITLNKLRDVGRVLDLQFVYGFVPKDGSLNNLVNLRATELAKKIVLRTNQNMKLEDQAIEQEKLQKAIKELAYEIKREMRKSLWQ